MNDAGNYLKNVAGNKMQKPARTCIPLFFFFYIHYGQNLI
jgi:hypothetical protein